MQPSKNPKRLTDLKKYEDNLNYKILNFQLIKRHNTIFIYEEDGKSYYSRIKDFSRLISSQETKNTRKAYFCKNGYHILQKRNYSINKFHIVPLMK